MKKGNNVYNRILSILLVVATLFGVGSIVSFAVETSELADYTNLNKVIATIPDGPNRLNGVFDAAELANIDELVAGFDMYLPSTDQAIVDGYKTKLEEDINSLTVDLSKAEATVTTVLNQKKANAGDVITVTVKLTTNYPVTNIQLPIIYDKTQFSIVGFEEGPSYLTFADSFKASAYDLNGNANWGKHFSYTLNPTVWNTDEAKSKYDYAWITAAFNVVNATGSKEILAVPNDEVFVTFELKALTDIEDTTQSVFISPEWTKTATNAGGGLAIGFSTTTINKFPATFKSIGMTYNVKTIAVEGVTISGEVETFDDGVDNSDVTTIEFFKIGSDVAEYTATVEGSGVIKYAVEAVEAGTYTVNVSKANHATRTYEIVVEDADVTQNMKIHLLGDINGNGLVQMNDLSLINAHLKETKLLEGYALSCADINGNGVVQMNDMSRINAHLKETGYLWK